MASVTVELAPDAEARLRDRAARAGETLEQYIRGVVEREAGPPPGESDAPDENDALAREVYWLTHRTPEEIAATREQILAASPPARVPPPGMTVFDMTRGMWPGTETDAEIRAALERLS